MVDSWEILKLLADTTRVRLLGLLDIEELSVAELQEVLAMGQSRISSHLSLLRQADLVMDRREGKRTFYTLNQALSSANQDLLRATFNALKESKQLKEDRIHLKRVLEKRMRLSEQYFNTVAGRLGKQYCPGRSWEAIGHFLFHLVPNISIVDLGAGEGVLSQLLARRAQSVVCIDNAQKMVDFGSDLAKKNGFSNLQYQLGELEAVPLADESFDLALMSQALHHAKQPLVALKEAYRILKPGARLIIIDLLEHQFEQARELYADVWLGFSENKLYQMLQDVGFKKVEVNIVASELQAPHFKTILASATRSN